MCNTYKLQTLVTDSLINGQWSDYSCLNISVTSDVHLCMGYLLSAQIYWSTYYTNKPWNPDIIGHVQDAENLFHNFHIK